MTSPLRLYLGLWARMLVTSGVTVLGQGFILALECIVIAVIAIQLLSALHVSLLVAFVFGLSRWSVAVVSRYREYLADRGAVAITGDPAALASALETLNRDLERRPGTDLREHRFFDRTRWFVDRRIFGTHPRTTERIEQLRTRV